MKPQTLSGAREAEATDSNGLGAHHKLRTLISDSTLDIMMGVLLAFAGVASSWSGYQAALWDGTQAAHYTQSGIIRSESMRASDQAGQYALADVMLLTEWLDATAAGDQPRAEFYRNRFRPEFEPAFNAWLKSDPLQNADAHQLPFYQPEYSLALMDAATQKMKESEQVFLQGEKANDISDMYVRATVLFAMGMFFIGTAQQFKHQGVRFWLTVVATLMLGVEFTNVIAYPIASPG